MRRTLFFILLTSALQAQWITGFYAAGNGALPVGRIPWTKYTHIIHFAAAPGPNGTVSMNYLDRAEIRQLNSSKPAGKKTLVCIKDDNKDPRAFAENTSPAIIATFVNNIVQFVTANGYDGVDLDWEAGIDVARYNDLLTRLRAAMPGKVITMDAGDWGGLENVAAASQSRLDQINVMCYDMDNDLDCQGRACTWHNAALLQNGETDKRACDRRTGVFTSHGVAPGKIGIGIPFYGRRRLGATEPEVFGTFPRHTVYYRDLASDPLRFQAAYKKYDVAHKADYLSIPSLNEFISYNGERAIRDAVAWQKSSGFGGLMTFTVDYEYLKSQPGDAGFPLSTALYAAAMGSTATAKPASPSPAH